jgi:hypothetical protein
MGVDLKRDWEEYSVDVYMKKNSLEQVLIGLKEYSIDLVGMKWCREKN